MSEISEQRALNRGRMVQLDFLRGIAILLVLGTHFTYEPRQAGFLAPFATVWKQFGWTGVDLFFVLSGFLVGGLLFKEIHNTGALDARRFLIRRAFKIWPAYYFYLAMLFLILVMSQFRGRWLHAALHIAVCALHIQNYTGSVRGHLWSLAVEEHFYLLLPFTLALIIWRRKRSKGAVTSLPEVPLLAMGLFVFCLVVRCLTNRWTYYREWTYYSGTHIRIDSLFFGVLLAYLHQFHPERLRPFAARRGLLLTLGLLLICPMAIPEHRNTFVFTIGYTLLYLGYGCILLAAVYSPTDSSRFGMSWEHWIVRLTAFIGTFSYSIYLWHNDIANGPMQQALRWSAWNHMSPTIRYLLATALYVTLAALGGMLLAKLVELPGLALRERLFPDRRYVPETAEAEQGDLGDRHRVPASSGGFDAR